MIKRIRILFCLAIPLLPIACGSNDNDVVEKPWLEAIELDQPTLTLEVTDTDTLSVITDIGDSTIVWESSNPDIAIVGENGGILALNSGITTITATVGGLSASCEVTVDVTIFIGGSAREFEAAYWKNGEINYLTTTGNDEGLYSWVNSIKVLDGHLFAGGIKLEQNAVLWKGYEVNLIEQGYKEVKEMAAMEDDLYFVIDNGHFYKWNDSDGVTFIRDEGYRTNSIFIENEDIYIGGITQSGDQYQPTVWKNGTSLILDYNEYTNITEVYAENGIFYAAGTEYIGPGAAQGRYWVNTDKTDFTDGSSSMNVNSMIVKDGDIYIAGHNSRRPALWVNGEITYYEEAGVVGSINEIVFFNGDLYAAGSIDMETSSVGIVWKNREEIFRTDVFDQGYINCIEIK